MTNTPRVKIDNTQILADSGLKIRHFHTIDQFGFERMRNMTVAFKDGRSTFEMATAVVHPDDCFSKKMGTKLAVEAFLAGKTVRLPKAEDFTANKAGRPATAQFTLRMLFG